MQYSRLWALALVFVALPILTVAKESLPLASSAPAIAWYDDYHEGLDDALSRGKLALIWFEDPSASEANEHFENDVLTSSAVAERMQRYVAIRLPANVSVPSGGQQVVLLDHPAFAEMRHSPGLAIVDMTAEDAPHYRQIISVYPFNRGVISPQKLAILLDLPLGSLTQRTLIFAVRTHPEHPASTAGHFSQILSRETEAHAWHQASIMLQGHHNWNHRFHAINAELGNGLIAREICAESWRGQNLLEAAEDLLDSWRQSPGHWDAVRSRPVLFAYDMKRGANGVWYAAGIFASFNP